MKGFKAVDEFHTSTLLAAFLHFLFCLLLGPTDVISAGFDNAWLVVAVYF